MTDETPENAAPRKRVGVLDLTGVPEEIVDYIIALQDAADEAADANGPSAEEFVRLQDELEQARRQIAEHEGIQKRTVREIENARDFAITKFAKDVLDLSDNFERAVATVDDAAQNSNDQALKDTLEGLHLMQRTLKNTMAKHGITEIEAAGKPFDPNFHEVMLQIPDESVPPGAVAKVFSTGYTLNTRLLRAARVAVARGPA